MEIVKNTVVSLHYEMYDDEGDLLDQTQPDEPMVYLHGGFDGIFPLVEEALHGKKTGDKVEVNMTPDDAFGERDEELVRTEPEDAFPEEIEVGMMFEADDPDSDDVMLFTVTDISDGFVVVDGNHPLAGRNIRFVATVSEVRAATEEELEHGHVHGPDDHHVH